LIGQRTFLRSRHDVADLAARGPVWARDRVGETEEAQEGEMTMGPIAERLVAFAQQEWAFFGRSTRALDDGWHLVGDEADEPWRSRIGFYWAAVDRPGLDGGSTEPWSAAFVSWCFRSAGAGDDFTGSDTHSIYVGRVLRHEGMSPKLALRPPDRTPLAPGDLIWNARGDSPAERAAAPEDYGVAVAQLRAGIVFLSHADIVVAVRPGECDSIGGNVSNRFRGGGSVVRSTWRLDARGTIADPRKAWIGVIENGL
jgi:hypothetical protein